MYRQVRDLVDIPRIPESNVVASLGRQADKYLRAHGWTASAMNYMSVLYDLASTKAAFVDTLMLKGAVGSEMEYLWDLVTEDRQG